MRSASDKRSKSVERTPVLAGVVHFASPVKGFDRKTHSTKLNAARHFSNWPRGKITDIMGDPGCAQSRCCSALASGADCLWYPLAAVGFLR